MSDQNKNAGRPSTSGSGNSDKTANEVKIRPSQAEGGVDETQSPEGAEKSKSDPKNPKNPL